MCDTAIGPVNIVHLLLQDGTWKMVLLSYIDHEIAEMMQHVSHRLKCPCGVSPSVNQCISQMGRGQSAPLPRVYLSSFIAPLNSRSTESLSGSRDEGGKLHEQTLPGPSHKTPHS